MKKYTQDIVKLSKYYLHKYTMSICLHRAFFYLHLTWDFLINGFILLEFILTKYILNNYTLKTKDKLSKLTESSKYSYIVN
jgi:hypothetical protein